MTDFYAQYITKTTFDPETHSVRSKLQEHHEKDENGKVIEHPIEESTIESLMTLDEYYGGGSMSGYQGQANLKTHGPKSNANPHNHEMHAKDAFKSGMRSKSAIVKHVEKKTGQKIHPDVHKMIHNSPGMSEAATKNSTKNQHTKTPEMSVPPLEIPEKLVGKQHKLDHNKDDKIDASDMKMVRKKGAAVDEKKSMATLRNRSSMDAMDKMGKMAAKNEKPKMDKRDYIKVKSSESVKEEHGEGEKDHITAKVHASHGATRGTMGGTDPLHVGSHGSHHAYNVESPNMNSKHNHYAIHNEKTGKTHEIKLPPKSHSVAEVHKHIKPHGGSSTLAKHISNDHNEYGAHNYEEAELEEGTFRVSISGLPSMHITGSSAGEIKQSLRKMLKDPKAIGNIEKITPSDKKKDLRDKMSEDNVDEVSKDTLASYTKKATMSAAQGADKMARAAPGDKAAADKGIATVVKRNKGVSMAMDKMTGKAKVPATDKKLPEKFANPAQQAAAMAAIKAKPGYYKPSKKKSERVDEVKQDSDVKSMPGTQPAKYYKGVSKSKKDDRAAHFAKQSKMSDSNPAAYKKAPGDHGAKTKPSKATLQVRKMMDDEYHMNEKAQDNSLAAKAKKSGIPAGVLRKVFNRGMAAWKTGHRPGTSQHQWAHARVNAFIKKGSGTWGGADKDLAAQARGSKSESVKESLWQNIHDKKKRIKAGSGERMRNKGEKGAPTADQMRRAQGK